jgi:hypothetical protein
MNEEKYSRAYYENLKIGILCRYPIEHASKYMYLEFGGMGIIPDKKFSEEKFPLGYYAVIGIELLTKSGRAGNFIEMGCSGVETRAEKAKGEPYYSYGFQAATGFRAYIGR